VQYERNSQAGKFVLPRMMESLTTAAIEKGWLFFPPLAVLLVAAAVVLLLRRGRRRWVRPALAALCLIAAVPFAAGSFFSSRILRAMATRTERFSFHLVSDGTRRDLAEYAGKVVVLNFWATWCGACLEELPDLDRLAERYKDKGLVVVTVSDELAETLRSAAAGSPARVNGYFEAGEPVATIDRIAQQGRPATIVLDRRGAVSKILVGAHRLDQFEAAVQRLL